jgi:hypothetical protein
MNYIVPTCRAHPQISHTRAQDTALFLWIVAFRFCHLVFFFGFLIEIERFLVLAEKIARVFKI